MNTHPSQRTEERTSCAPANSRRPSLKNKTHRWSEKKIISLHKSESCCLNPGCNIVKVSRHEFEGGRELHWTEFWRGLDRIEGKGTPRCEVVP